MLNHLPKDTARIVAPNFEVRSMGYNGFPRGINDNVEARHERPEKYFWCEHSERNAIYNAARVGTALEGSIILVAAPIPPCMDCARGIIQSGITTVVIQQDLAATDHPTWAEHAERVRTLFSEAKTKVINLNDNDNYNNAS